MAKIEGKNVSVCCMISVRWAKDEEYMYGKDATLAFVVSTCCCMLFFANDARIGTARP